MLVGSAVSGFGNRWNAQKDGRGSVAGAGEFSVRLGRNAMTLEERGASSTGASMGRKVGKVKGKARGKGTSVAQRERNRNKPQVRCPCDNCAFVFNQMSKVNLYRHLKFHLEPDAAIAHYEYFSTRSHRDLPKSMTEKWFQNKDMTKKLTTLDEWMAENKPPKRNRK